jgi:hypothetical protein
MSMKSLSSRVFMLLVGVPLMLLGGCTVDVGARDTYAGHYGKHHGGYYSRGYYRPGYYTPVRREARVVVEPSVRVYANDPW